MFLVLSFNGNFLPVPTITFGKTTFISIFQTETRWGNDLLFFFVGGCFHGTRVTAGTLKSNLAFETCPSYLLQEGSTFDVRSFSLS